MMRKDGYILEHVSGCGSNAAGYKIVRVPNHIWDKILKVIEPKTYHTAGDILAKLLERATNEQNN